MNNHDEILKIIESGGPKAFDQASHYQAAYPEFIQRLQPYFELFKEIEGAGPYALEFITAQILQDPVTESTPKLLETLAVLTTGVYDTTWHHSVCHNFERYPDTTRPSFLHNPKFFPAAKILVDHAIATLNEDDGNFGRIAEPIARYNLDFLTAHGIPEAWPFKPTSFSTIDPDALYPDTLRGRCSCNELAMRFIQSKTPAAFIQSLIDNPLRSFGMESELNETKRLISFVYKSGGSEAAERFLEKIPAGQDWTNFNGKILDRNMIAYAKESYGEKWIDYLLKSATAHSKQAQNDITPGVFVDVEGTLIANGFNKPLASYLTHLLDNGIPVTVFTGGDVEKLSKDLEASGLDRRLFPIQQKVNSSGKCLEVLIDDTAPNYQIFAATIYENPFDTPDVPKGKPINRFAREIPSELKTWEMQAIAERNNQQAPSAPDPRTLINNLKPPIEGCDKI